VPPDVETALSAAEAEAEANGDSVFGVPYQYPPPYPQALSLKERVALEKGRSQSQELGSGEKRKLYEPVRHENTGMDSEEALYESHLLSVPEALEKLEGIPVMQHVVRVGWEGIVKRLSMERF